MMMTVPRLAALLRFIALVVAGAVGSAVLAFVGANVVDYVRFHAAFRRVERVSASDWKAMADRLRDLTGPYQGDPLRDFAMLKPIKANIWSGGGDLLLYELSPASPRYEGEGIYLYARISNSERNAVALYFTNFEGKQRTRILWNRDPELTRTFSPVGRIVTLTDWSMHGSRDWIVLEDRIMVIDRSGSMRDPVIVGETKLEADGLSKIRAVIKALPVEVRGKDFRHDHTSDGFKFEISFDSDGQETPDRIRVSNAWVEQLLPLLTTISELAPKDCPVEFVRNPDVQDHLKDKPVTIRMLAEAEAFEWPKPRLPYWCVWRSWLD
ncbi:MAG TPA: hypothetical protein VGD88_08265 [Opitutaceae bacterium]